MMNSGTANIPARDWHDSVWQSAGDFYTLFRRVTWLAAVYGMLVVTVTAQEPPLQAGASPAPSPPAKEDLLLAPAKVDVNPVACDEEIRQRLQSVLDATDWFTAPEVRVEEGVVFNEAQGIALQVLTDHPAVLSEPEPSVLADSLGKATVNLRVYFWINGREHSWSKVRSSVIRLVKRAFQEHGISMPDEAREVVFPRGIPITMLDGKRAEALNAPIEKRLPADAPPEEPDVVSTKAEGGLQSEAGVLDEQARQAQPMREGENLLPNASDGSSSEEPARKSPAKSGSTRTSP